MASWTKLRAPILAVFSGSSRQGSVNTKLARAAERLARTELGATTRFLDLQSYNLPLYSADLEANRGMPDTAMQLKHDLARADGWIIASPEYNGFVTPLLLNAMTWCSRGDSSSGVMYETFQNKSAIVLSASPGALGGMRSLPPNRELLTNLGVNVLPQSVAIGGAYQAFKNEDGNEDETTTPGTEFILVNEKQQKMLSAAVHSLFVTTRDAANREATCEMIEEMRTEPVGEYGSVNIAK